MRGSSLPPAAPDPHGGVRTVVLGTAGHIDHGKSSLVRALTGVDPDRLQEERERGMTIDLGFAPYRHRSGETVGIIDVPGHERFIRNMVAGATSVDVVLLVVAADDGVMPQTVEHVQILELLGVSRGLVALTKVDLVDAELAALAEQDVATLLADTALASAPVLPVSTVTGEGLEALREVLDALVDAVPARDDRGPFRLPVQRVFSAAGRGLVVTGVPVSGCVRAGDELQLVHDGRAVRVRAVQAYGVDRELGRAGHSTALNLAGAGVADVRRGHVVATPDTFRTSRFVTFDHRHVGGERALRSRHPVRLHTGTAEALGRAVPLEAPELRGRARGPVQVRLDEPVVVAPGDRVLLRDAASLQLLGGGLVLAAGEGRLKRFKERVLDELAGRRDGLQRPDAFAESIVRAAGFRGCSLGELALQVGRPADELAAALEPAVEAGRLHRTVADLYVGAEAVEQVVAEVLDALRREHRARPLLEWLPLTDVRRHLARIDDDLLRQVLAHDARVEVAPGGRVRRRGHRVSLSAEQQAARERVLAALAAGGASPPAADAALAGLPGKELDALLDAMRRSGEIVVVEGIAFHAEALGRLEQQLLAHGRARGGAIDIPALRDELGTTRKYLIPLLEHFDARGLTARHGEKRVLRGAAAVREPGRGEGGEGGRGSESPPDAD